MNNSLKNILSVVLSVMLVTGGLTISPVYGFSVSEERKVGEQLLSIVRRQFTVLDDPDISQYINRLGNEIIQQAGPQLFDYHFFVIANKDFNAFSAPSGLIFLHTGLIDMMDSEDELVSVMAHEIGHTVSRHIADRMEANKKINVGTMALVLAGIAMGGGPLSEALITGSVAAGAAMELKFSRKDEEEADRLAYKWMVAGKRNPAGMAEMLKKMRRVSRLQSGNLPPYLLTHPQPGARLGYVQDLLMFSDTAPVTPANEFEFLRIKNRLAVMTREPTSLIAHFKRRIDESGADSLRKKMAWHGLAMANLQASRYDEARQAMLKVIEYFPDNALIQTDMARVFSDNGRYQDALPYLEKAVSLDRDNLYSKYHLAYVLQHLGKLARSGQIYEGLLNDLPDYSKLYYQYSRLKAKQGEEGAGFYYLGLYYRYEGDLKNSIFNFQKAIQKLPDHDPLRKKAETLMQHVKKMKKETEQS
jgi:predicted Zn-dependent protease